MHTRTQKEGIVFTFSGNRIIIFFSHNGKKIGNIMMAAAFAGGG